MHLYTAEQNILTAACMATAIDVPEITITPQTPARFKRTRTTTWTIHLGVTNICKNKYHEINFSRFNESYTSKVRGGRVVRCQTCDREVVGSNPAVAVAYQRQLSMQCVRGRLMSTIESCESWGERPYQAMH